MSRIFLAGLLGGLGMFFWTFAAYTLLPLGNFGISRPHARSSMSFCQSITVTSGY
jgi:hypothetical protein